MAIAGRLTLARFHARVLFVNHIKAAFAAHDAAILIAFFGGFQGAKNFHDGTYLFQRGRFLALGWLPVKT
jgi:hypothetical protein